MHLRSRIAALSLLLALLLSGSCFAARPAVGEEAWITPVQAAEGIGGYTSSAAAAAFSHQGEGCGETDCHDQSADWSRNDGDAGAVGYSDSEINMIANVVNGEVGGIAGASVILTYADGSQLWTDGYTLRLIHAKIVDNQVRSSLFPSSVRSCVGQCWSWGYTGTAWNNSTQWQECRQAVVDQFAGVGIMVPTNVFAATCDPAFASYGAGWKLWARVDWDTGWFSGTFYYYCYG